MVPAGLTQLKVSMGPRECFVAVSVAHSRSGLEPCRNLFLSINQLVMMDNSVWCDPFWYRFQDNPRAVECLPRHQAIEMFQEQMKECWTIYFQKYLHFFFEVCRSSSSAVADSPC